MKGACAFGPQQLQNQTGKRPLLSRRGEGGALELPLCAGSGGTKGKRPSSPTRPVQTARLCGAAALLGSRGGWESQVAFSG